MDVNPIILERESPFSNKWLSMFSFNELGETSRFIWKLSLTPMNLTNAFKR